MTDDKARILLVEDEELNRTLVKAVLTRAAVAAVRDATLLDAGTLADARRCLSTEEVDLILLDMNLPDGHGLVLARELATGAAGDRRDDAAGGASDASGPERRRPAVIAVTASVLPQDRAAAVAAGCDGFLDKPYAAADLVSIIAEHLSARRTTAAPEALG
jgi:two-component system KDP operon response regulator KdpE